MKHDEISAVEWRITDNTLQIQMQDGREITASAYALMQTIACKYEWLFEPRVGTIVIPSGSTCSVCTPNAIRHHLGQELFFAHIAEWLNNCSTEQVEETADDGEEETMQETADDAWREWRRQQDIL